MAKAKMEDAVKALETIRDWMDAVLEELEDLNKSVKDPSLTAAIQAAKGATTAVDGAVAAATTANTKLTNQTLPSEDAGKIRTAVEGLSSRVGKGC